MGYSEKAFGFVRPYRGERYDIEKPFGMTILVLGESSYDCPENAYGPLHEDWSEGIISHVFRNERDITITRAACMFAGGIQPFHWRQQFWRPAAFTNFVQHSAGSAPRQRPTMAHWIYGKDAFQKVLDELKPQFVLALGKELWGNAFRQDELSEQVVSLGVDAKPFCLRAHLGGFSFIFGINHPSSYGWTYAKWSPWVMAALEKARQIHRVDVGRA